LLKENGAARAPGKRLMDEEEASKFYLDEVKTLKSVKQDVDVTDP